MSTALVAQIVERQAHGDPGAGDRGRARAAVSLDHVAVQHHLPLAQSLQIDHGAQAAADQALDLLGPARLLARRSLAATAGVGGSGQHAVFGGDPALALAAHPAGNALLDRGRHQHLGVAEGDQARAFRIAVDAGLDGHGTQLVIGALRMAHESHPLGSLALEAEAAVLILKP